MNISEVPAFFWMVVFGVLAFLFGMVLYYLAMSVKESNNTIKEVTETVKRTNKILDETTLILKEARQITSDARGMLNEVNETIMPPVRTLGSILNSISGIIQGLQSGSGSVDAVSDQEEELDFSKVNKK